MERTARNGPARAEWYALRDRDGECEGFRCGGCGGFSGGRKERCPSCGAVMANPSGAAVATKCIRT